MKILVRCAQKFPSKCSKLVTAFGFNISEPQVSILKRNPSLDINVCQLDRHSDALESIYSQDRAYRPYLPKCARNVT
jgi:hypothetical protein